MDARPVLAVLLAVVALLAGCSAPLSGTATPSDRPATTASPAPDASATATAPTKPSPSVTPADGNDVSVTGDLPVDPDPLFDRVERLMAEDVEPSEVVVLERDGKREMEWTSVDDLLGVGRMQVDESKPGGYTARSGVVYLDPKAADVNVVERTLVHEFVHVVQRRSGMLATNRSGDGTTDGRLARRSVAEGSAVYVTDAYVREYMTDTTLESAVLEATYEAGDPAGNRLSAAPYHFGYRYAERNLNSTAAAETLFDPMPTTTEQILHDYDPGEEPPVHLRVDAETGDGWKQFRDDRAGEMFLRVVLRTALDRERAAAAAAGWGNDAFLVFGNASGSPGLAWVLRWDDAGEADEAAAALRAYADHRRGETGEEFAVQRVSDDTVVLLAGQAGFVDAASVDERDGVVRVQVTGTA